MPLSSLRTMVSRHRRYYDERLSKWKIVRQRKIDFRNQTGGDKPVQISFGSSGQKHRRLTRLEIHDAHIPPIGSSAKSGSQSFRARLFRRKSLGVAGGAIGAPVALGTLDFRIDSVGEPIPKTIQRSFNTTNIYQIASYSEDHGKHITLSSGLHPAGVIP